ncbi:ferritin-like domain-containing protein [Teichococcus coralli]|uniref:ferritin-like domain-containing protein n=1 Tax=Teichococcus coralli TaxID=2545983 RepID=UPI003461909D
MSETTRHAQEIYVSGLRNQHAVEKQAVQLLERQVGRLENYPEMEARLREHIGESEQQAKRIEQLLEAFGSTNSTLKDMGLQFMGNMAALAHAPAPDEVVKNTFANFAFEHFEIASYRSLLVLAETVGHQDGLGLLRQSLQEEEAMARWIDEHLRPTTLRYLERSASGQTAGR